ncbi:unnamed protein product [Ixodes persulcatus]
MRPPSTKPTNPDGDLSRMSSATFVISGRVGLVVSGSLLSGTYGRCSLSKRP